MQNGIYVLFLVPSVPLGVIVQTADKGRRTHPRVCNACSGNGFFMMHRRHPFALLGCSDAALPLNRQKGRKEVRDTLHGFFGFWELVIGIWGLLSVHLEWFQQPQFTHQR